MSINNCSACSSLRDDAPELFVNGLTNTMVTSLKNNTGLVPGNSNNDCDDLNDMADCLVGNMAAEVDSYEVCDWKDFMKNFIPNVWTTFKGIIAAICGLWTNLTNLQATVKDICKLQEANLQHPVSAFGTRPNGAASYQGGSIGTKNGQPILTPLAQNEMTTGAWPNQNVGIRYGTLKTTSCSTGHCTRFEWIAPDILGYRVNANVTLAYGDVLWSCTKSVAQTKFGITDEQWAIRAANPITWSTDFAVLGTALVAIRMAVVNDNLQIQYGGCIGAANSALTGNTIQPPADQAERLYKFSC